MTRKGDATALESEDAAAPPDWDGAVFFSVGTARVLPNRRLQVQILGFNDKAAQDFLTPELPLAAGARVMPKPITSKPTKRSIVRTLSSTSDSIATSEN